MGKKKRPRKLTAYMSYEGHRERLVLKVLDKLYQPYQNNINIMYDLVSGGNADGIVSKALKHNDRDKVSAWLDEDFEIKSPLSEEIKNQLARCWSVPGVDMEKFYSCKLRNLQSSYNKKNRNPCLIVSQPASVESLILKILGYTLPFNECNAEHCDKQVAQLKDTLGGIINKQDEFSFYEKRLTHELLEEKRGNIPELNLLVYMLTK